MTCCIGGNSYNTSKSKYSFFSQHMPLTQLHNHSMDDSSRSELQDENDDNRDEKCADNAEAKQGSKKDSIERDDEEMGQPKAAPSKAKGKGKKQSSIASNLNKRELVSHNGGIQQPATKKKGQTTTAKVHKNTRSIPTDPVAFLSTYKQDERSVSEQSFESPSTHANNSKKMSSQISLSEEKVKDIASEEAPDDDDVILEFETAKSSRQKKRARPAAPALKLTEEQVHAIKEAESLLPITEEDLAAIENIARKRQRCKEYLEATDCMSPIKGREVQYD